MKARLLFFICFVFAFGAGLSVGALWQVQATEKPAPDHWLAELKLTPEQREKIKAIWGDAMKSTGWQAQREKRDAAQKEREKALIALITPEQLQRYEEIQSAYQKKLEELSQESKKAKDEAYERTKAELSESQRGMYDELRKKRMDGRHRSKSESKSPAGGADAGSSSPENKKEADGTQQTK